MWISWAMNSYSLMHYACHDGCHKSSFPCTRWHLLVNLLMKKKTLPGFQLEQKKGLHKDHLDISYGFCDIHTVEGNLNFYRNWYARIRKKWAWPTETFRRLHPFFTPFWLVGLHVEHKKKESTSCISRVMWFWCVVEWCLKIHSASKDPHMGQQVKIFHCCWCAAKKLCIYTLCVMGLKYEGLI